MAKVKEIEKANKRFSYYCHNCKNFAECDSMPIVCKVCSHKTLTVNDYKKLTSIVIRGDDV
jgi:hypothetical protein